MLQGLDGGAFLTDIQVLQDQLLTKTGLSHFQLQIPWSVLYLSKYFWPQVEGTANAFAIIFGIWVSLDNTSRFAISLFPDMNSIN